MTYESVRVGRVRLRAGAKLVGAALLLLLGVAASPITAQQRKVTAAGAAPSTPAASGAPGVAAPPPPAAAARRTGSIGGRVVDSAGQPLAGATVHARPAGEYSFPVTVRITASDAEGQFRFDDLPAAPYSLNASVAGYASARRYEASYAHLGESVTLSLNRGGVITGRVTKPGGAPAVATSVRVMLVRDAQGRPAQQNTTWPSGGGRMTDDRGVYRIYGLAPGTYVASVHSGASANRYGAPGDSETTVYHPSATRDTAVEITVGEGQEVGGVDIQLRGERGHRVSGTIAGVVGGGGSGPAGVNVTLVAAENGMTEMSTYIQDADNGDRTFELDNVADGEYEISARRGWFGMGALALISAPRRVSVKGADVTGLELSLAPLGSLSGRVVMLAAAAAATSSAPVAATPDSADECAKKSRVATFPETVIQAQRAGREKTSEMWQLRRAGATAVPDQQGDFTLRGLEAGRYRLRVTPPGDEWYVSAISFPGAAASAPTSRRAAATATAALAAGPGEVSVRTGQQAGGVTVTLAAGAARLRGRVVADEGASLPIDATVYLIPNDVAGRGDNPLRYRGARLAAGGAFELSHLAPGRYSLLVQPGAAGDASEATAVVWDAAERARLRRAAEATNDVVELPACAVTEHALRYAPAK